MPVRREPLLNPLRELLGLGDLGALPVLRPTTETRSATMSARSSGFVPANAMNTWEWSGTPSMIGTTAMPWKPVVGSEAVS
ncbi:hypothetical protein [Leifsonia sp. P73]|uniref:hypothetical protein n=1 Tax=Leifsonia sp. P73 TaxID=3423959 RepID=UPI003DA55633